MHLEPSEVLLQPYIHYRINHQLVYTCIMINVFCTAIDSGLTKPVLLPENTPMRIMISISCSVGAIQIL